MQTKVTINRSEMDKPTRNIIGAVAPFVPAAVGAAGALGVSKLMKKKKKKVPGIKKPKAFKG